jgi:signal transduction histidine kinase
LIQSELNGNISPELHESFDSIQAAGHRITRTIDMILNMAELQTGNFQPLYKQIDLRNDILSVVEKQYKLNAEAKKLELKFVYNTDKLILNADEYSLGQIFANLIDNAIKYTKSGGIQVEVGLKI